MTVINTNISALFAQNGANSANADMQTAMQRLSTGKRINSAKDDAAGLSIASRMTSQLNGITVAIRNANDGVSLAQTAEGALGQVTDMLTRMKELAVQSANGTLGDSDRASLQNELTQLVSEVNNISKTTNFNGIKLLDGSTKSITLQTGVNATDQVAVKMVNSSADALGLNGYSVPGQVTTGRVGSSLSSVAAGDILLNGKNLSAANLTAVSDTATALAAGINSNTVQTGVSATAYNTLTSGAVSSNGVATGDLSINGTAVTGADASTIVSNINRDVAGVNAVLNSDNTITLSNNTGKGIVIAGSNAGAGGFTTGTYNGYVALNSSDGSAIKITAGATGVETDFNAVGLNQMSDGATITGGATTATALTTNDDLKINGTLIGASSDGSAGSKVAAINAASSTTGVTASASTQVTAVLDSSLMVSGNTVLINGATVTLSDTSANGGNGDGVISMTDVVGNINKAGISGVVASTDSNGNLVLTSQGGNDISIQDGNAASLVVSAKTADGAAVSGTLAAGITAHGQISLASTAGGAITITGSSATLLKVGLSNQGGSGDLVSGALSISTQAAATSAMSVIDQALDTVSTSRGDLGAIENRLQVTVDNLTTTSDNLTDARSRIQDADFSAETTDLAKSQILSQAATAMLAQANQSKQSVLSLLK